MKKAGGDRAKVEERLVNVEGGDIEEEGKEQTEEVEAGTVNLEDTTVEDEEEN